MDRLHLAFGELDRPQTKSKLANTGIQPWSQEQYVRRARSFHWSWASRQSPADVTTCARYGWCQPDADQEVNVLVCSACKASLYLPWDDTIVSDAKYFEKISSSGHASGGYCPWRIAPCRPEITALEFPSWKTELQAFTERIATMAEFDRISVKVSEDTIDEIIQLAKLQFPDIHTSVLLLALLQWKRVGDSLACVLGCCELSLLVLTDDFDPVGGHAWFCPTVFNSSWKQLASLLRPTMTKHFYAPLLSQFTCDRLKEVFE
ncbi:hypothetical protein PSACC_02634 [Paramicrosporidium saccamoebae]|uniref:C3HC-type domain-containing protein n=1 Tax=Paramicrosporidium saccamoebae TaxID=1246581 RepID=A0A2H9TIH1_9FUNG|nr:hypothetical protein PSACC_02634 [Paramicrosporidium saccamoebae]